MKLKSHHLTGLLVAAIAVSGLSVVYGLRVAADSSVSGGSSSDPRIAVTYTGPPFVGQPKTFEDLNNCRVIGKSKKQNSYYYLREDITDFSLIGGLREIVCFVNEADAKSKGFMTRKTPPAPGESP